MKTNHDEHFTAQTYFQQFNLQRFITAQAEVYPSALEEIRNGKKRGHWIWYIFPQIKCLGYSSMCEVYSISCFEEAQAYWANRTLSRRLRKITKALLTLLIGATPMV